MKNGFISLFENKITIKIKGKNINRFLKRLVSYKIDLFDIKYLNKNEVKVKIRATDYKKIKEIKTIYDIFIVDVQGMLKIKKIFRTNFFLIVFFFWGLIMLILLTNIIFEVEVIHTNKELRNLLLTELKEDGIVKLKFQKKYNRVQEIKKRILSEYKDKIEWLEIEKVGIKYIVRVEERKLPKEELEIENRHLVARKHAIIKKIEASAGEIVKSINDYVKPGDIIISGEIKLYDQVKGKIPAKGKVYGEVWYQTKVTYPLVQIIEKPLSNYKNRLGLEFLNKKIELLSIKPFKNKKIKQTKLINHPLLPITLWFEKQQEIEIIEEMNTLDEAINGAIEKGIGKIKEMLTEEEYIVNYNNLKVNLKSSKIELDMFFVVYEDITDYQPILDEEIETE